MRACLIGAYPPTCGEASLYCYWAARGLAERGHQILVVTDYPVGQSLCYLDESDAVSHQPEFTGSGGSVRVLESGCHGGSEPGAGFRRRSASLARCATSAMGERPGGVIAAAGDEPYAAAGYLAACRTGSPLLIPPAEAERPVPTQAFHPDAGPLDPADIDRLAVAARAAWSGARPGWAQPLFDPALPCFGSYDRPGSSASARLLIAALAALESASHPVTALIMADLARHESLWQVIMASGLAGRVWLLPLLPPWRQPGFIRRCTAVCCLGPAGSTIAAEILACGTCLVLPERARLGLPHGEQLEDGISAVMLPARGHGEALAGRLRTLAGQPDAAARIGRGGLLCAGKFRTFAQFTDAWEARLRVMTGPVRRQPRSRRDAARSGQDCGPDLLVEAGVAAAARRCQGPGWLQAGLIAPPGRPLPQPRLYEAMNGLSSRLLEVGLAADFFFLHKPPGVRLRFRCAEAARQQLSGALAESLTCWEADGLIGGWRPGIYEPEEHLFGGPVSMRSVHRIFTADSLAWLGYHAAGGSGGQDGTPGSARPPGPGWAMSLLMIRALLDGLEIVGWEDRDVWDRLRRQAGRRISPVTAARPELARLAAALRSAWSAPATLAARLSPAVGQLAEDYRAAMLAEGKRWHTDYLASGEALVGARELAAFLIVFHWNRAGFTAPRQGLITEALLASRPGAGR